MYTKFPWPKKAKGVSVIGETSLILHLGCLTDPYHVYKTFGTFSTLHRKSQKSPGKALFLKNGSMAFLELVRKGPKLITMVKYAIDS